MGDARSTISMRTYGFIVAIIFAAVSAAPSPDFNEAVMPTETHEDDMLLQAKSSIRAMRKKGLTLDDCKKDAHASCKDVQGERRDDVKILETVSTGRSCVTTGQLSITRTKTETTKVMTKWKQATLKLKKVREAWVPLGTHRFKSLKVAQCAIFNGVKKCDKPVVVFPPKAWANYQRAAKIEAQAKSESYTWYMRAMEAEWSAKVAYEAAMHAQTKCLCSKKTRRDVIWDKVANAKRDARQKKLHKKCKLMGCLLKGTPVSHKSCKDDFKPFKKPKLVGPAEKLTTKVCLNVTKKWKVKKPTYKSLSYALNKILIKNFGTSAKKKRLLAGMKVKLDRTLKKYIRDKKHMKLLKAFGVKLGNFGKKIGRSVSKLKTKLKTSMKKFRL